MTSPWCGPYILGRYSDNIVHGDPCDCDLDEESAGDRCLDNSEWEYGVFTEGGAFAERLIVRLPKRPPPQRDDDLDPLVAVAADQVQAVTLIHRRSIHPATTGDHRGSHYCRGCTTSVDDFTAYVDWPCPTMRALTEAAVFVDACADDSRR